MQREVSAKDLPSHDYANMLKHTECCVRFVTFKKPVILTIILAFIIFPGLSSLPPASSCSLRFSPHLTIDPEGTL